MHLQYSKNTLLICALVALSAIKEALTVAIRGKRSTSIDDPCDVSKRTRPVLIEPLKKNIDRLKMTIDIAKEEVRVAKSNIKTTFGITDLEASRLDLGNFTDRERMLAGDEQRAAAINQPLQALSGSYSLLQELVYYVEYISTNGTIGTSPNINLTETRNQLKNTTERLCSCLRSVKTALLSNHIDVVNNVTRDVLSESFTFFMRKNENKTYHCYRTCEGNRAYIVMGDSDRLMEYLSTIYSDIYQATV